MYAVQGPDTREPQYGLAVFADETNARHACSDFDGTLLVGTDITVHLTRHRRDDGDIVRGRPRLPGPAEVDRVRRSMDDAARARSGGSGAVSGGSRGPVAAPSMSRDSSSDDAERFGSAENYRTWEEGLLRAAADSPEPQPPARRDPSPPRRPRSPSPDDLRITRISAPAMQQPAPPLREPRVRPESSSISLVLSDACRHGVEGYMSARRREADEHEARLRKRGFVVERRTISGTALTLEGVWKDPPPSPRPAQPVAGSSRARSPPTGPRGRPVVKAEEEDEKPVAPKPDEPAIPTVITFPTRLGASLAWNAGLSAKVKSYLELCVPLC